MVQAHIRLPLLLAALLTAAACQSPDVGQPCTLDYGAGADGGSGAGGYVGDFVETGKPECENLVCIRSAGDGVGATASGGQKVNPYCSKPCTANKDCYTSETGLVCRPMVLDPDFMNSLTDAQRQKYLGDIKFSNYCAVPVSQ